MRVFLTNIVIRKYSFNAYDLHNILWTLFSEKLPDKIAGMNMYCPFQYRATLALDGALHIYMTSDIQPDISALDTDIGEVTSTVEKPFSFIEGKSYNFILRANPTKTNKTTGKMVPVHAKDLGNWLKRKLAGAAEIENLQYEILPAVRFVKEGVPGTVHAVHFMGTLCVTDANRIEQIVFKGIGREKFLGFGLMTLTRVNSLIN